MSKTTIQFEIVTPERLVSSEEILQVTVPTESGEITILPNHIPLVSLLKAGVLEIKKLDQSLDVLSVSGGFIEVSSNKVIVLADTAERAEELDEAQIQAAQLKAEELKKNASNADEVQFAAVAAQLESELARSRALSRWRRLKNININK